MYAKKHLIHINNNHVNVCRISNDSKGNARYVIHYLNVAQTYNDALQKAKIIGGKKYRAKWYGGGIVFASCNLRNSLGLLLG